MVLLSTWYHKSLFVFRWPFLNTCFLPQRELSGSARYVWLDFHWCAKVLEKNRLKGKIIYLAPGVQRFGPWSLAPLFEELSVIEYQHRTAGGRWQRNTAHLTVTRKHRERQEGLGSQNPPPGHGSVVLASSQQASPLDSFTTCQKDHQLILYLKHSAYGNIMTQLKTPGNPSKLAPSLLHRDSRFWDLPLRRLLAQLTLCMVLRIPCPFLWFAGKRGP